MNAGLYFLVFGESLFNDGVTVVLYNSMTILAGLEQIEEQQVVLAIISFFFVVLGGFFIGVLFGALVSAILTKAIYSYINK